MHIYDFLQKFAHNDLLELSDRLFELGPLYKPARLTVESFDAEPLSIIIGEHPSEYSLSPQMWNTENYLAGKPGIFLPLDIPVSREADFTKLLDYVFAVGKSHFRVLAVTNPYKVAAYHHLKALHKLHPERIAVSDDAEKIGAVNMILIDQQDIFHLVNSDGRGMANAAENFLGCGLAGRKVCVLGAGGAARAIIYEIARRVSIQPGGSVAVLNRTLKKAGKLVEEFSVYFPGLDLRAEPMENLSALSGRQDILFSSITSGDPLLEYRLYESLPPNMLIVDVNYGVNSVYSKNAASAGRNDLQIQDGRGMVIEGYIIPSRLAAQFWGWHVSDEIYQKIAIMFGYGLSGRRPGSLSTS